jgi:hypothetical protein
MHLAESTREAAAASQSCSLASNRMEGDDERGEEELEIFKQNETYELLEVPRDREAPETSASRCPS